MIHCYQFEGLNIVLDCYSGSIHMVDEVAYDMIQWYENEPADTVVAKAIEKHGISKEDAEECIAAKKYFLAVNNPGGSGENETEIEDLEGWATDRSMTPALASSRSPATGPVPQVN